MGYSLPGIGHNAGMYTPTAFSVTDDGRLHALMRDYPFAAMVTAGADGLHSTHLPFMVNPKRGAHGTLLGHVARANPHWRHFDGKLEATAIFTGPHAYVSPTWYTSPRTVPTWNYAAVHAHGRPRVIGDKARVRAMLESLVERHEAAFDTPWTLDQAGPDLDRQLDHIVAFEMEITRLEGKFKLNQNRSRADREGVVQALADSEDSLQRAIAEAMRGQMDDGPDEA